MKRVSILFIALFLMGCEDTQSSHSSPTEANHNTQDLSALSDQFDGSSLDPSWSIFDNDSSLNVSVSGGALNLTLSQTDLWFNANEGPLVYKNVTGNFKVTAPVRVRRASAFGLSPNLTVNLGGISARDPDGSSANYVFIVLGEDVNDGSVETKNTAQGCSYFIGPTWTENPTDAELRICRLGQVFRLYKRPIGSSTWELADTFDRTAAPTGCPQVRELPQTLQVGPVIYAANGPDVQAQFDRIEFAPVSSVADCTAD